MSKVWVLEQKEKRLAMTDWQKADFTDYCKAHPGAIFRLEPQANPVSDNMRGYYYGAAMPFLRSLVPQWENIKDDELHEILKKAFNYFEAYNPVTKRNERYGMSVMSSDKQNKKAMEYMERIADWVLENYGQHMPSPEDYKEWRDSAKLL